MFFHDDFLPYTYTHNCHQVLEKTISFSINYNQVACYYKLILASKNLFFLEQNNVKDNSYFT